MNPAILTEAQAAPVRATQSATIPRCRPAAPPEHSAAACASRPSVGPGGNDVEARSTYNAVFFSANRRLSRGLR
jgi:hypothetical protein